MENEERAKTNKDPSRGVPLDGDEPLLESFNTEQLQDAAVGRGVQALWQAILPLVGILPSRPGEYAGVFKVEPGPGDDEATVYLDIPSDRYERGKKPRMERVVALTVRLTHDYRLLGENYYCVDCEAATRGEARH